MCKLWEDNEGGVGSQLANAELRKDAQEKRSEGASEKDGMFKGDCEMRRRQV